MKKHKIVTFGCRLNSYESEVIRQNLDKVESEKEMIVFNTCAVTKEAERQARQSIRKAKRKYPDAKIVVTGCAAQIDPKQYAEMPEVDSVLGNEEKLDAKFYSPNEAKILVNDIMSVKETASHMVSGLEGRARAYVQVQNGCNHRCTFCIIPYGRGNSRSVPIGEIVKQVQSLVDSGYKEIVLTGVDMTDYGKDLPASPTLGQMVKRLLNLVPDLPRLRLSSIDVAEIDKELFELMAYEPRMMPHVHISLQAGDDMVLKRMKRRHNRAQVIEFCNSLREIRPQVAFGADIIAGFPTESEEMFENTLNLISEAKLQHLHVFPYSPRKGTPAAKMPQVVNDIKKIRAKKLRDAGDLQLSIFNQQKLDKSVKAIIESNNIARADDFSEINIENDMEAGLLVNVAVTEFKENKLFGKII